ncbi:hypothetical protein STVIR_0744 [Streptomyces viridochromogenes Tue57]|uniref:Uncharacterized protein n=1 Tax=Streptomyces viridochromogenes Tue57 TaxID=1160705 RepID=L8PP80_STRVR|nr:hypothetical protein STVIR_0744 [Streptomyces viridochromogenes Tue57]
MARTSNAADTARPNNHLWIDIMRLPRCSVTWL